MEFLKLLHGSYNVVMMVLFIRQGVLGIRIRQERVAGRAPLFEAIKRHRHAARTEAAGTAGNTEPRQIAAAKKRISLIILPSGSGLGLSIPADPGHF